MVSSATMATLPGYSRVLTIWPTRSHGTEYRLRATDTRQVLETRAGFST